MNYPQHKYNISHHFLKSALQNRLTTDEAIAKVRYHGFLKHSILWSMGQNKSRRLK